MISKLTYAALVNTVVGEKIAKKCPFGYTSGQTSGVASLEEEAQYPSQILTCSKDKVLQTTELTLEDYSAIAKQILEAQHAEENQTEEFHKGVYAACLLRLEGHDLMDFRKEQKGKSTGGSDGCVNFQDADNAGLSPCLQKTGIAEIYDKWCHKISVADFMVLAAEVATGSLSVDYNPDDIFEEGTLLARFRNQYRYGRKTVEECPDNFGLMPNPENSCNDLQKIFIEHVYNHQFGTFKAWALTAALSGAHTLGFAKPKNSGYDGFWGDEENQAIFNNDYYRNVIAHGWGPQKAVGGNEGKNQWVLIDSSPDEEKAKQMMLNTDMCLFYIDNQVHAKCMKMKQDGQVRNRKYCKRFEGKGGILNAKNPECCAWYQFSVIEKHAIEKNEPFCGLTTDQIFQLKKQGELKETIDDVVMDFEEIFREPCCVNENKEKSIGDCDNFDGALGPAHHFMILFAKSNDRFYQYFLESWKVATENGWNNLKHLDTVDALLY